MLRFSVSCHRGSVDANRRWCCTYLLDPSDPLFVALGEAFVRQQVEGCTMHMYLSLSLSLSLFSL